MSDRELLELAAKAAGVETSFIGDTFWVPKDSTLQRPWNPLTDDGDALRLAVKLGIHQFHSKNYVRASRKGAGEGPFEESKHNDPCAATRRAIVRAAAEIGRNME